jgi:hypothetical protein
MSVVGPHTGGPDPILEVRSIQVGAWTNLEVQTAYPGVRHFPMGVRTHC